MDHLHGSKIEYPHHELHRVPADLSRFWVITVISNPCRFKRRYQLYWDFAELCYQAGVNLVTVEAAFGDRQFMVTRHDNRFHLQLRSVEELWHKENLINLGIKHACSLALSLNLPPVREVAWVDADCRPSRPGKAWFEETWHELQHYEFVQMWESLIDLNYNYVAVTQAQPSFMANYVRFGFPSPKVFRQMQKESIIEAAAGYGTGSVIFGRPGLAWAANVDAINKVGGLIDCSILGAGDYYMAHGLLGTLEKINRGFSNEHIKYMLNWQDRATKWIKRDVGYVSGTVFHDFHGKKVNRAYGTRGKILSENMYNPHTDIKYDSQGLLQLETYSSRQIRLRDQIRAYFRARSEDAIE
jgi:hypothetical protein